MFLQQISLTQFKNYSHSSFKFTERITGISGMNGRGKTNLLDAVYYLCFTKSYFSKTDAMSTQFETDGFRLEGTFSDIDEETGNTNPLHVTCIFRNPNKKEFYFNKNLYEKFSAHIGKIPAVMIAPDDVEIILGGSEERRKFLDTVLSQIDGEYLKQLITYNKILLQRNSALKIFAESNNPDYKLLDVLDIQLLKPALHIHKSREEFTEELLPVIQKFYHDIADNQEEVNIKYESQLNDAPFETLLKNYREKDLLLQRTNAGIHKDDLSFQLNGQVFKNIASQGQRKSLLFSMKLAEFELLAANKGFAPLLLLDDVFEKLDEQRMFNLLKYVCIENDGQVFITDTSEERLRNAFEKIGVEAGYVAIG